MYNNRKDSVESESGDLVNIPGFEQSYRLFLEEVSNIHRSSFCNFKNIFQGRDVVLLGCGATLNFYEPIRDAIHVGVNHSFLKNEIPLDYFVTTDYNISIINNIKTIKATKFIGRTALYPRICYPTTKIAEAGGSPYFVYDANFLPSLSRFNIFENPFPDYHSVIFIALQIVLLGNPAKIYLVGCDCVPNHFDTNEGGKFLIHSTFVRSWQLFREMLQEKSPSLPIISVNPIGLKDFFIDLYQNKAAVDACAFEAMGESQEKIIGAARAAAQAAPTNLGVAALLGRLLQKNGCLSEASKYLRTNLKKFPSWSDGIRLLANILSEQGELQKAARIAIQGIQKTPDDLELRCCAVSLLKKIGNNKKADALIENGPNDFSSYYGYRLFFAVAPKALQELNPMECLIQMKNALSYYKNPYEGDQWILFIQLLIKNNQISAAENFIKSGFERNHSWNEGYFQRSFLEEHRGQIEKSIDSVCKAIYLAPLAISYRARLAGLLREQGQLDQAISVVDEVLHICPRWSEGLFLRSTVWEIKNNIDNALNDAEAACTNDPSVTWLWRWLCELCLRHGKSDTAKKAAQTGIKLNVTEGWPYHALFRINEHVGSIHEIEYYARMAVKNSPDVLIYREYLASCLQGQHKLDEAEAVIHEAIRTGTKIGWAWRRLSWIYKERGDIDKAIEMAQRAISEDPADASLIKNLEQLKNFFKQSD